MSGEFSAILVPVYIRPSTMVREQACIGLFIQSEEHDFFVTRLATNDSAVKERVLAFFKDVSPELFDQALQWAECDISYTFRREKEGDKGAFHNLVRPRENMVRYGEPMMVTIRDREADVEELYHQCVGV